MDGPAWSGTLRHNVCCDVPQILYEIGNLTTALEKWGFDGRRSNARWFWRWAGGAVRGLRCEDVLAWKKSLKRQNMTRRLWEQLEGQVGSSQDLEKKIRVCCLFSSFSFHNTRMHVSKTISLYNWTTCRKWIYSIHFLTTLATLASTDDQLETTWWQLGDQFRTC